MLREEWLMHQWKRLRICLVDCNDNYIGIGICITLVAKLAPPHAQSAWEFRGERVRAVGLAACCNYFSKKKKHCNVILITIHLFGNKTIIDPWR